MLNFSRISLLHVGLQIVYWEILISLLLMNLQKKREISQFETENNGIKHSIHKPLSLALPTTSIQMNSKLKVLKIIVGKSLTPVYQVRMET